MLLANGVRLQGEARRLESGELEVVYEGTPLKFAPTEVAALEVGGKLELIGAPYALVVATREALQAEINRRLEAPFRSYAKRGLIADARVLLDEMRDRGLGDATFRELDELISRKTESTKSNRARQRVAAKKSETKARGLAVKMALATSKWLGEQGQFLEATAVLSDVEDCYSDADYPADLKERLVEAIAPLVPPEFPWGQGRERFGSWLVWAKALAPSGARFATPDEMKGRIEKGSPWARDTVAICTDNLLLITRNREPEVIGPCLLNGEAAVQTLDGILNDGVGTANQRLEVRIHRSRKEYLEEDLGKRAKAPEWSAGFYNPILKASRFYVGDEDDPARQGRALHVVVAHELTHQYIAERWAPAEGREVRNPTTPGFWVVEGFARFIEDQSLEIGRRGTGLDDPTVQSVECAASLFDQGRIVPVDFLVDAAQLDFLTLENKPIAEVQLTSTLKRLRITQIGAFYDEAGALTFFLMNRCGPEGRAAFLKALSDHYRSESKRKGWRDLGFKDEEALEAAFRAFLKNPAAG